MRLQEPYLPDGFDEFWKGVIEEADSAPLEFDRRHQSSVVRDGFQVDEFSFRGVKGETLNGWIASPLDARRSPAFQWIAPYGRWSMPPNEYGTRPGMVSLSFNFHGEPSFHEESYKPERGYFAKGIGSKETWVFKTMFQNSFIAQRILGSLPEVDPARCSAMGLSQGGGLAVWLGAFSPLVKSVVGDLPFGAARPLVFGQKLIRYPLKEIVDFMDEAEGNRSDAMHTMAYFDTVNLATKCNVPTLLTLGERDPAVKDFEVESIYAALPGVKHLERIDWGHDWHPSMVERNQEWMLKHA